MLKNTRYLYSILVYTKGARLGEESTLYMQEVCL